MITTFALSWGLTIGFFLMGGQITSPYYGVFGAILMWTPGIVALFFSRKEKISLSIFSKPKLIYFAIPLIVLSIITLSVFFSFVYGKIFKEEISHFYLFNTKLYQIGLGVVFGLTLTMFVALGEELMWRGYLMQKLIRLRPIKRHLIIGSIWGVWHAPIIFMGHNYPGHPVLGIFVMCFLCLSFSPLLEWAFKKGGSIMYPAAIHSSMNALAGLSWPKDSNPNPLIFGAQGITGIIALIFIYLIVKKLFPLSKRQIEFS